MAVQYWQQNAHAYPRRVNGTMRKAITIVQRVGNFLYKYWAALIMSLLGLIVLAAFSVPILSYFGFDRLSKQIFFTMHIICAQIPSHSTYICGHQCGLCVRCTAIYSTLFVTSAVFVFTKKRLPGIPWWLLLLFVLPMAWDGGTQLFGLRESTWQLRVLTGTLFGLGCAWFTFPLVHKTMLESQMPLVDRSGGP